MADATAPHPAFGLAAIGQIGIAAHDLDRAVAFYRDVLGMRFLFRAGDLAFFDCGGIRLMLSLPERPEFAHPASILYYRVDDLPAAHAALESPVGMSAACARPVGASGETAGSAIAAAPTAAARPGSGIVTTGTRSSSESR